MKKSVLQKYARLIATVGGNVQKGQEVLLYAGLDQPEFVAMVAEECYRAGAKKVWIEWSYMPMEKIATRWEKASVLGSVAEWQKAKLQHMVDVLPVRIYLDSDDPDGLKGIRQAKYAAAAQKRRKITKPYRDAIDNKHQWCIAAVPGKAWAKKMFPELRVNQAVEKLWEAILFTSRVTDDPAEAWRQHNADLTARCKFLNDKHIRSLHYQASNGTDLTVGLMEHSIFAGGSDTTLQGVEYNPNIPSEECFTTPRRGDAEGVVYATKPLSYMGQLIENFSVRFHEGKAVEVHAEKNEDLLRTMISMDENAAYLGECALVPKESPISRSGLLFYNTLFDENAACHLALGAGFDECVEDFARYTKEELRQMGVNDSLIHVDFMIGCDDLAITGITGDGTEVPIFRNGTWAF